jgi:ribosomal protein S12 methylthiotransferase
MGKKNNKRSGTVSLVSLGCPKNQADAEGLLRKLSRTGIGWCPEPGEADVVLVNTCGFIEDAKRESIDEILRLADEKTPGRRLVVMGCLSERYRTELREELPEVDALFGVGDDEAVVSYCRDVLGSRGWRPASAGPGEGALRLAEGSAAPLKVADGCDRRCSFCVIPSIRGPFRSCTPEHVLREARELVGAGMREIMLVAQDLTRYGRDLKGRGEEADLPSLLSALDALPGDFWVRPLYLHPSAIGRRLLRAIRDLEKVSPYVDMPLQHSEAGVLRRMKRGGSRQRYLDLVNRIRDKVPGVTLRTALIVGFPGETEEDFEGLLDFVERARFDRLGAFRYSREEGTPAARMRRQVTEDVKEERLRVLMDLQAGISLAANRSLVGSVSRALVEAVRGDEAVGRLPSQAPEIDGLTIIKGRGLRSGDFADVRITGASHYDLEAEAL